MRPRPAAVLALACAMAVLGCTERIRYGPNSTMVSLDDPVGGCRAYRLVVDGGYAPAALYFRRADGTFTRDRTKADCPRPKAHSGR